MLSARTALLFALTILLAHAAVIAFLGTSPGGVLFSNLLGLCACGYAALVCFMRMWQSSGFARRFWRLIASGYSLWSVGQVIFTYYETIEHRTIPTLSPTDVPYLAYYLPLAVALLLPPEEAPRVDWVRTLDLAQVGIVLSSVYLYVFFYKASAIPTRWEALSLGLDNTYNAFNIILVVAYSLRTLTARAPVIRILYRRVLFYLMVYALGDALYTYAVVNWRGRTGMWFDLAYTVPFLFAAVLAAREVRAPEAEDAASAPLRTSAWASVLPILAPLFVLGIGVHIAAGHLELASIILVASFLCFSARLGVTQFRSQRGLELLRSSEQRFSKAFHSSLNAMAVSRLSDGRMIEVNDRWLEQAGFRRQEIIGRRALDLNLWVRPEDHLRLTEDVRRRGSVREMEAELRDKAGNIRLALVSAEAIDVDGEPCVLSSVQDITDRKKAEEVLRASQERFSKTFHLSPHAMIITRLDDGRYVEVNERWAQMIKLSRDQMIGRTSLELNVWVDPADRAHLRGLLEQGNPVRSVEVAFRASKGNTVLGLMSADVIEIGGVPCILAAVQDITEKKQLEVQLRQAQKMEAIGRLAGGIAHDFNNLLSVMMGRSELLLLRLPQGNALRSDVDEIRRACESAAGLTRQLLAFSRRQMLEPKVVNLNAIVQDTQKILRRLIGEHIDILARLEPALGRIKADPAQIEQVIINLAVNARDAMPDGGRLHIETSNAPLDQAYARLHPPLIPGAYVRLEIRDTGAGMDSATQARIFEPFFTTKELGKGTGLGLATVYSIVKQSGGYIWVSSELGKGTSFQIYLPRVEEAVAARQEERRPAGHARGKETILIVEDDAAVRSVTCQFLQHGGYNVLESGDGAQALATAQRHPGPIHMLVTDLVLPGGSGISMGRQLASLRPEMKILYVSGYSDHSMLHEGLWSGNSAFLRKPFACEALLEKVRALLDRQPKASGVASPA